MQVDVSNVSFAYDNRVPHALSEITFRLAAGERVCILGASGSGKSTLLMLLAGLLPVSAGTVHYAGQPEKGKARRQWLRRRVAYAMQQPERQLHCRTAFAEVMQGPRNLRWPLEKAQAATAQMLQAVGLDVERAQRQSPFHYSGSEKRRIALAGALVTQPRLLLLDEPTAGLDHPAQEQVLQAIDRSLAADAICVLATHDIALATRFSRRVLVLHQGRLAMDAHPAWMYADDNTMLACGMAAEPLNRLASALNSNGWSLPTGRRWDPAGLADALVAELRRDHA